MDPKDQLQEYRTRIDAVDEQITDLLIERTEVVQKVARLKGTNWPGSCHIRPAREGQMHRAIAERFYDTVVPPRMGLAIWRQLIGGSTHIESPLNITYLRAYPEHRFLAREYFGVQIGARFSATLTDALGDIRTGESNILVLPHPESHSWWTDTRAFTDMGLRIFAAIPVEMNILPADCTPAVALAAVTPEESGDDLSYFINSHGGLEIVNRFLTEYRDSSFIGAHPHPVTISSGASRG